MSYIQVTSAELKNRASELQGLNSRYQSEIENVGNILNTLNSMWEGEAKEAFNNAFSGSRIKLENFKQAIETFIQALNVIAMRYEEAEKKNLSIAGKGTY